MLTAIRDTPESAPVIKGWIEKRAPRVSRAVSAFRPIFDEMLPGGVERCATVLSEIDQFGQTTLRLTGRSPESNTPVVMATLRSRSQI